MRDVVYCYDGSFDGFLCCVFDSYMFREYPIRFQRKNDPAVTMFPARLVETDLRHARQVLASLESIDPGAKELAFKGFLTCLPDRERMLYRFIRALCETGGSVLRRLSGDAPLLRAVRHLDGEVRVLKGFVRFSEFEGVLIGEIRPENRVLPLLWAHFCGRMCNETFLLCDYTNQEVLIHRPRQWAILPLEEFRMAGPSGEEGLRLWKQFAIESMEERQDTSRLLESPAGKK